MTDGCNALLLDQCFVPLDPALSEQAAFEAALDRLAPLFDRVPLTADERRHALLTVTQDGGSRTSVAFWAAALETGLGLASPSAFPWCLANASCGTLARRFAVTGPNYTWLAADLASPDAFAGAAEVISGELDAIASDRFVWVMANRFCGQDPGLAVWLWGQGGAGGTPVSDLATRMSQDWEEASRKGLLFAGDKAR